MDVSPKHGSSGARVVVRDQDVLKFGEGRVTEQGVWLARHESPSLPRVYRMMKKNPGYVMERLNELPRLLVSGPKVMHEMVWAARRIWDQPALVPFVPDHHRAKVFDDLADKFLDAKDRRALGFFYSAIEWDKQTECLTHGDPTYDNVMLRGRDQVVLTDPIPATTAVPDMRSVDLGKMAQSIVGFEAMRYGEIDRLTDVTLDYFFRVTQASDAERPATMYWCVVHLLRAAPYVKETVQDAVVAEAIRITRTLRR